MLLNCGAAVDLNQFLQLEKYPEAIVAVFDSHRPYDMANATSANEAGGALLMLLVLVLLLVIVLLLVLLLLELLRLLPAVLPQLTVVIACSQASRSWMWSWTASQACRWTRTRSPPAGCMFWRTAI